MNLKPIALVAATLLLGAASAQAADYRFQGITDSGPLSGQTFSGSFSFDDGARVADGDVALTGFSLSFAGQSYRLDSADVGSLPVASFAAGSFIGLGYLAQTTANFSGRPAVGFLSGFTQLGEASFAYRVLGAQGGEGFGSYTVSAVPEPQTLALMLAGLAVVGAAARRRAAG